MEFETANQGLSKACWTDNVSGDFLTSSARVGAVKLWNASQPHPKETLKVSRHGVTSIVACQRDHFLMQLTSGQILLFNTKTRKTIHLTEVAHTKQI
jgi:WD40 repeat protein